MLTRAPRIRLAGHGERLRLRQHGHWEADPLDGLRECCRASMAIDKAMGEAIRGAVAAGASWSDIGRVLGVAETAETQEDVMSALADSKRAIWTRFWQ